MFQQMILGTFKARLGALLLVPGRWLSTALMQQEFSLKIIKTNIYFPILRTQFKIKNMLIIYCLGFFIFQEGGISYQNILFSFLQYFRMEEERYSQIHNAIDKLNQIISFALDAVIETYDQINLQFIFSSTFQNQGVEQHLHKIIMSLVAPSQLVPDEELMTFSFMEKAEKISFNKSIIKHKIDEDEDIFQKLAPNKTQNGIQNGGQKPKRKRRRKNTSIIPFQHPVEQNTEQLKPDDFNDGWKNHKRAGEKCHNSALSKQEQIELRQWILKQIREGRKVTKYHVREQGIRLSKRVDFRASESWGKNFLIKHNIIDLIHQYKQKNQQQQQRKSLYTSIF